MTVYLPREIFTTIHFLIITLTLFIQQFIFPGGMDYAETLKRWREAFAKKIREIKTIGFDENFIKIWNFYYCYCEAGFMSRRIDVAQILFEKKET